MTDANGASLQILLRRRRQRPARELPPLQGRRQLRARRPALHPRPARPGHLAGARHLERLGLGQGRQPGHRLQRLWRRRPARRQRPVAGAVRLRHRRPALADQHGRRRVALLRLRRRRQPDPDARERGHRPRRPRRSTRRSRRHRQRRLQSAAPMSTASTPRSPSSTSAAGGRRPACPSASSPRASVQTSPARAPTTPLARSPARPTRAAGPPTYLQYDGPADQEAEPRRSTIRPRAERIVERPARPRTIITTSAGRLIGTRDANGNLITPRPARRHRPWRQRSAGHRRIPPRRRRAPQPSIDVFGDAPRCL